MSSKGRKFSKRHTAAVRLNALHWIDQHEKGFLLHPKIAVSGGAFKVMDVACGTGIWTLGLAKQYPNADFTGFDLYDTHFPNEEELPANIKFFAQDATEPLSKEHISQYDVVHVGRVYMYLDEQKLTALINNIVLMLKRGGYLQWDEVDVFGLHAPRDEERYPAFGQFRKYASHLRYLGANSKFVDGIYELPDLVAPHGLHILDKKKYDIGKDMWKFQAAVQLMGNVEYSEFAILPSMRGKPRMPTEEEWWKTLQDVEDEVEQGLRMLMPLFYFVAKKL